MIYSPILKILAQLDSCKLSFNIWVQGVVCTQFLYRNYIFITVLAFKKHKKCPVFLIKKNNNNS
jgi:hypothetical protein